MVYFCSIQKLGRRNKKKNETGIFYKTRDIRLGTRVYCQKYWKSSLSAVQWAPWWQLQPWRSAGSGCRRPSCFFRFFSRLLPQKRSCETGNYIVRNVMYNSAIGDASAGVKRCWNSFVFNAQSSLKWVRAVRKTGGLSIKKPKKTIKTSFRKWYFPALTDSLIQLSTYIF